MLSRMCISMPQRNAGNEMLSENTYIKRKMTEMRMTAFTLKENNNHLGSLSNHTRLNRTNNHIQNTESGLIRNFDTEPGITKISMRAILGEPKKNCSSCRGG